MRSDVPSVRGAGVLALAFALSLGTTPSFAGLGLPAVSGVVRDSIGNRLSDVEVLFVAPALSAGPAAAAFSDGRGRFRIRELRPGAYTIAAAKAGYVTFVGRVDTAIQSSLDLVLRPAAGAEGARQAPSGSSWALRVPSRSVLRELDARVLEPAAEPAPGSGEPVAIGLDQLFSAGPSSDEDASGGAALNATETRMTVASALGSRASLSVEGRRERLGAASRADAGSNAHRDASSMHVDLSYDVSAADQLDFQAYYDWLGVGVSSEPGTLEQSQRSWGYDARWSRRLDERSRMALAVDFRDTALVPIAPRGFDETAVPIGGASSRAVSASGRFDRMEGPRHEVQVEVRAQFLAWPALDAAPVVPDTEPAGAQWSVQADAWHTWSPVEPLQLVSGLGYRHAPLPADGRLVVPRLGARWSRGAWILRGLLSYHLDVEADAAGPSREVPAAPERLGYESEFQIPLGAELGLRGGASFAPVEFGSAGYAPVGATAAAPLYLTDGSTAVHEQRLALVDGAGRARASFELARGRADGRLAALLPFGAAYEVVSEGRLRYRGGRLGLDLPDRGTSLMLEYERVTAESSLASEAHDALEEWLELRLRQGMRTLPITGDWYLLVALRVGSVETDGLDAWRHGGGDDTTLEALNRRVSAGVSVLF